MALENYSFVVNGVLAGCKLPKDAEAIRKEGFKTLVTLTEAAHPLAEELSGSKERIRCVHIPIEDFKAPSLEQMETFAEEVVAKEEHWPILVHCRAGIGRTGTMLAVGVAKLLQNPQLASTLTCTGKDGEAVSLEEAAKGQGLSPIEIVRVPRPASLEVKDQVEAVKAYMGKHSM